MNISIVGYKPEAECEISGKVSECIIINSDRGIRDGLINFDELRKMVRFLYRQEEKQNGQSASMSNPIGHRSLEE